MDLIIFSNGIKPDRLDREFWKAFQEAVKEYDGRVIVVSTFRGWLHQFDLWVKWKLQGLGNPANEPGRSSHNFGMGIDAVPVSGKKEDKERLKVIMSKYGIKQADREDNHYTWHKWKQVPLAVWVILAISFFQSLPC